MAQSSTDRIEKKILLSFDRVPLARRAEAYRMNDQGWAEQMKSIERHVAQAR